MTTPYGAPMYPYGPNNPPPAQVPGGQPPGWGGQQFTPQPGQPGYQAPMPPQQFQQQGQPQYQAPQPPVQQPQQGIDLNVRIAQGDPRFPQEMWGKTLAEGIRYYNIMREDFVRRNQGQQGQQGQQPQYPQGQPQQFQGQPQRNDQGQFAPPQQGQPQRVDPIRRAVDEALAQAMPQYLAPMVQQTQQQQRVQAYQSVSGRFQDWNQFDAEVQQELAQATPEMLASPGVWEAAYYLVKGRRGSQPQRQQQPWGGQQPTNQPQMPPQQFQGNYFAEGPTPPASVAHNPNIDPRDEVMAARFGMPLEVYRAGKGNPADPRSWPVPPLPQQQGQQQNGGANPAGMNGGYGYGR